MDPSEYSISSSDSDTGSETSSNFTESDYIYPDSYKDDELSDVLNIISCELYKDCWTKNKR